MCSPAGQKPLSNLCSRMNYKRLPSDIGSQTIVVRRANTRFAPTLFLHIGLIPVIVCTAFSVFGSSVLYAIVILLPLFVACPSLLWADNINKNNHCSFRISDTGQTKCYDNEKEIPCPSPGEDFYGQDANYNINPKSFTKLDDQGKELPDLATEWTMVRDNITGLIWEVKTDDGSIHDKDNQYTWYDTEDFINSLNSSNYGGFSDWRLPTVAELASLVNYEKWNPSINRSYFPKTQDNVCVLLVVYVRCPLYWQRVGRQLLLRLRLRLR